MNVNSGEYRKNVFVLRRYINDKEIFVGQFPVVERINLAFADQPFLTLEEFSLLSDSEYLNRLNLFYNYLEIRYPMFQKVNFPELETTEAPIGTDVVQCPLDYTIAESIFANLELVISGTVLDKRAKVNLTFNRFNGDPIPAGESLTVKILIKAYYEQGYVDWSTVEGYILELLVPSNGESEVVLPEFRYMGIDDGLIDFKNIHAQIIDVEELTGVEIGPNDTVFTESFTPFYLANVISNIDQSYQDFPNEEALEGVIDSGKDRVDGNKLSFIFEFNPNQVTRPVFMYPASYPDLTAIEYMNDGGMNILDSGAFDLDNGLPKRITLLGVEYKVYAAMNMILYLHRARYEYKF